MDLTQKKCVPCEGGTPPFSLEKINEYLPQVPGWSLKDGNKITRKFIFKDFPQAINFVDKIAELAQKENHHPDIYIFYSKVELTLWTHAVGGLSENDFILSSKINRLAKL